MFKCYLDELQLQRHLEKDFLGFPVWYGDNKIRVQTITKSISSLSYYPYQKDERAKSGDLLIK
jgi:hypothetical protein